MKYLRDMALASFLVACAVATSCMVAFPSNCFEDALGVVTDSRGLKMPLEELSGSVERTLIQLRELEGFANSNVQDRLERIRSIVGDAIGGTQTTLAIALSQMQALEA